MTAGSFDEQNLTASSSSPPFFIGPGSQTKSGNAMRDEVNKTEFLSIIKNRPWERDKSK